MFQLLVSKVAIARIAEVTGLNIKTVYDLRTVRQVRGRSRAFIAKGKDGRTPAMRLGLAKGPVRFEDVLYFD